MYFIREAGLESQHHQSDLIEALNNYHGNDGHEKSWKCQAYDFT